MKVTEPTYSYNDKILSPLHKKRGFLGNHVLNNNWVIYPALSLNQRLKEGPESKPESGSISIHTSGSISGLILNTSLHLRVVSAKVVV